MNNSHFVILWETDMGGFLNPRKEEDKKILDHSIFFFYWPWYLRPDYILSFCPIPSKTNGLPSH